MPSQSVARGGWNFLFVAVLFLLCLVAVQLWRSDESERRAPLSGEVSATRLADHSRTSDDRDEAIPAAANDSVVADVAEPVAEAELVEPRPTLSAESFELKRYASHPSVARNAPPIADAVNLPRTSAPEMPAGVERQPRLAAQAGPSLHRVANIEQPPRLASKSATLPRNILPAVETRRAWPRPETLLQDLEPLADNPATAVWADDVRAALDELLASESLSSEAAADSLARLEQLGETATRVLQELAFSKNRIDLQRAAYSLQRRVLIWKLVASSARGTINFVSDEPVVPLDTPLELVEQKLATLGQRDAWRTYLLLDDLRYADGQPLDTGVRRELATDVLLRMNASMLTREQIQLMQGDEFQAMAAVLRKWATEPVDYRRLTHTLEQYEREPARVTAHSLAADINRLRWTEAPTSELSSLLDSHYRNANIRIAISDHLLNRWLPRQQAIDEPVRSQILGARVFGRSRATSDLRLVLVPDASLWRMALEAAGNVQSQTESRKGPAIFYNHGNARYAARKWLLVDRHGIRVSHAEAQAQGDAQLMDVETEYDSFPLINSLARSIALQEYEDQAPQARRRMNDLVAGRAGRRMDEEVHRRLMEAEERFTRHVLDPLTELELNPTALDMETTETRLIARYRLAGAEQLAAHTPRPQAPSDSWLSLQLHESALNNTIEQFGVAGREATLRELFQELVTLFRFPDARIPEDLPEDVRVRFADQEPIRIAFSGGEAVMTLRIAELRAPDRHWQNFTVRASYRPSRTGLSATLFRDEYVQIYGPELGFREKLPLRAVFSTVLAKDRPIELVAEQIKQRPELSGLHVSQFVVHDGWLGLALGPEPLTDRTAQPSETVEVRR